MAVSLDYFKDYLGIAPNNTAQDSRLQIYLDAAWAAFVNETGRDIDQKTYPTAPTIGRGDDGYYSGRGTENLFLRQRPVILSGLAVYLDNSGRFGQNPDGSFDSTVTVLTRGTDYVLLTDGCLPGTSTKCSYKGVIQRIGTVWPNRVRYTPGQVTTTTAAAQGNVKVVYTAGWPITPYDVRAAVCQIAAWVRKNADKGGMVTSESLGSYSYSLAASASSQSFPEAASIRATINNYKEWPV